MRISVALCTYNGARHLPAQLDSIRRQTCMPVELVVLDDRSSDETAVLVKQFAQTVPFPVHFSCNDVNLGSTKNFERAMQQCRGEAIALCDQDDVWEPDKMARMTAVLQADPAVAGVFSNARLIDDNGKLLPEDLWQRFGFTQQRQRRFVGPHAAFQLLRQDTVTGATLVFRSSWLPRLLPIPEIWVHDGWIAVLLASMAELRALPLCLMSYRLHAAQQVGASRIALHSHLSTPVERASNFHRKNAERWGLLLKRMEELSTHSPPEFRPAPSVLADLRRKLRFLQRRAALLHKTRLRRLFPALSLLPGYLRYDKGVLSCLRDLTHRAA